MDCKKKGKKMKRIFKVLPIAAILASGLLAQPLRAQTTSDTASLEQRLDNLEQEIAILKRQLENNKEDATTSASTTPIVTANAKDGFSIKSPDNAYKLKIGGYVQADARAFSGDKKDSAYGTDSFYARRVRLIISGTVAKDFNFFIQPDLAATPSGGQILTDAYAEYVKYPWLSIRGGKFKEPFSLENLQDSRYNNFAELGLPANLYPQRDIGFQASGGILEDSFKYAVGIFNGEADRESYYSSAAGYQDNNNDKDVVGRVWISPLKNTDIAPLEGLGVGFAAAYGHEEGTDLPTYVSPGQVTEFSYASGVTANGPRLRTSPQASYYYKSFGLLGEYVGSSQDLAKGSGSTLVKDKFQNKAWQASGTYVLTGEDATYNGVTPRHDFNPASGNWGAFELAGRYGQLKLDRNIFTEGFALANTYISKEDAWAAGLNWYLNKNVKAVFDFEQTKFHSGAANVINNGNRKTENAFTSRLQLSF